MPPHWQGCALSPPPWTRAPAGPRAHCQTAHPARHPAAWCWPRMRLAALPFAHAVPHHLQLQPPPYTPETIDVAPAPQAAPPEASLAVPRGRSLTVNDASLRQLSLQEQLAQERTELRSGGLRQQAALRACLCAHEHRVCRHGVQVGNRARHIVANTQLGDRSEHREHQRVGRDALTLSVARQSFDDVAPQLRTLGNIRQPLREHALLLRLAQWQQAGAAERAQARLA
eukprot:scaffold133981_cov31-Tisochrysis_lutea.AAC.1